MAEYWVSEHKIIFSLLLFCFWQSLEFCFDWESALDEKASLLCASSECSASSAPPVFPHVRCASPRILTSSLRKGAWKSKFGAAAQLRQSSVLKGAQDADTLTPNLSSGQKFPWEGGGENISASSTILLAESACVDLPLHPSPQEAHFTAFVLFLLLVFITFSILLSHPSSPEGKPLRWWWDRSYSVCRYNRSISSRRRRIRGRGRSRGRRRRRKMKTIRMLRKLFRAMDGVGDKTCWGKRSHATLLMA